MSNSSSTLADVNTIPNRVSFRCNPPTIYLGTIYASHPRSLPSHVGSNRQCLDLEDLPWARLSIMMVSIPLPTDISCRRVRRSQQTHIPLSPSVHCSNGSSIIHTQWFESNRSRTRYASRSPHIIGLYVYMSFPSTGVNSFMRLASKMISSAKI
jgi:hypothetical protein